MTMTSAAKTDAGSIVVPSYFAGKQWQQVLERDAKADGQFVYAVKSTKIYCKPSCASRRPTRRQVSFFPSPALAEAAGYRPCKRCEPERAEAKADPQAGAIAAVTEYLKEHADEGARLADVAKATGVGRLTILRGFKRVLGVSPSQYAKEARLERFKNKVREPKEGKAPITEAMYEAGFGSSSRLYEKSTTALGMTPRVMREGGAGLLIRYTTAASPLGRMLVATTDVGVCSIAFGRDDKELVAVLREKFSKAQLVAAKGNTGWLADAVAFVASQLGEHPLAATFPIDVRATAFQQQSVDGVAGDSAGRDSKLFGVGDAVGCAKGFTCCGCGDWSESGGGGGALSSGGGERWVADGVSVGRGSEAEVAGGGKRVDSLGHRTGRVVRWQRLLNRRWTGARCTRRSRGG